MIDFVHISLVFSGITLGIVVAWLIHFSVYDDERKMKTHKAPLVCKIRAKILPTSPSALLFRCSLGLNRHFYTKCIGCEKNIHEKYCRLFKEGLEKGLKEGAKYAENIEHIKDCKKGFDGMPGNKEQ